MKNGVFLGKKKSPFIRYLCPKCGFSSKDKKMFCPECRRKLIKLNMVK